MVVEKKMFLTEMFAQLAKQRAAMQPIGRGRLVRNKRYSPTITTTGEQDEVLEYLVKHILVKSAIDRRCDAIIRRPWRLVKGKEEDRDRLTEFLESQNMSMQLDHWERQSCSYGKAPTELIKKYAEIDADGNPIVNEMDEIIEIPIEKWWDYELMPRDASVIKEIYHDSGFLQWCEFVPQKAVSTSEDTPRIKINKNDIAIYYNSKFAGYDISPSILDALDRAIESYDRTSENKQIMEDKYAIGFWQIFIDPAWIKEMDSSEDVPSNIMDVWNNTSNGQDIILPPGFKFMPQTMPMQGLDAIKESMIMAKEEIYMGFGWTPTDISGENEDFSPTARAMIESELVRIQDFISTQLFPKIMGTKNAVGLPKFKFLEDADTEVKTSKSDVMTTSILPKNKIEVAERKGITLTPEEIAAQTVTQMAPNPSIQIDSNGRETFKAANPTRTNYTGSKISSDKNIGE